MFLVVVISGIDVDDGMDKAEDEPLGSPIDHDVHGHVILVQGDLVHIWERCGGATEAELPANARKA